MVRPVVQIILARFAAVTFAVVAIAACAKPKPVQLGEDRALSPQLAVIDTERPPKTYTVTLAEPAHIAILAVFPGRGATLVYPRDTSVVSTPLPPGVHQLHADTVRAPALTDSALLRPMIARSRQDSVRMREDSLRRRGTSRDRMRDIDRERLITMTPERAYLMLFASRSPINYGTLLRRLQGVTIPGDPNEALSTVAKMARGATSATRWAAAAVEAELRR